MAIIEVKGLSSGYSHSFLFRDISFTITKPAFVAIVGLNGSGKSTFIKTLCKKQPFQGDIFLEGFNISALSPNRFSQKLAVLEQKNIITFSIPVLELVVMGRFRHKQFFHSYSKEDYFIAESALTELGLEKYKNKNFNELSGGEQQLVWLAQLIVQDSPIWLLDEPTQQLDLYNKKKVFDFFKKLVDQDSKTLFCVTHDISYLHNLIGHYYINFSETNPTLKIIDSGNIQQLIIDLESKYR